LGVMRTPEIDLLNKIEAKILQTYTDGWTVSDAVLAACLINPNVRSHNILFKYYQISPISELKTNAMHEYFIIKGCKEGGGLFL